MAQSRAKWEDMTQAVKDMFKKSPTEKADEASKNMGNGLADSAAEAIRKRREENKKALDF
jgi:hypothetical protein